MLKLFTTPKGVSIAINTDAVLYVEDNENGCLIRLGQNVTEMVTEPYLEVVARLNEKR